jgi:hypothetical protein
MQNSTKKLVLGPSSLRFTETKSPRGSQQQHQRFLPCSASQHAQGKSRVVAQRKVHEGNPFKNAKQPTQSSPRGCKPTVDSAVPSNAAQPMQSIPEGPSSVAHSATCMPASSSCSDANPTNREKRAQLYRRRSSTCPEVTLDLTKAIQMMPEMVSCDSARSGSARSGFSARSGIARLPTRDLIDQVDERNTKIEELLRMGEATIARSGTDASPQSQGESYAESEECESPTKSAERKSWEVLDLAADGVLKSLGAQLNAIAEFSDHSTGSPRSQSSENESENTGSDDSQATTVYIGEQEEVNVQTLDSFEDEQLMVTRKCTVGHDLKPHRTPSNRWWCSKCSRQVSQGTRLFGCRICNYDECWSCISTSSTEMPVACKPCVATNTIPQEAQEVMREEIASLHRQMSALRDQLRHVTQERDDVVTQNMELHDHVSKMWKATLSYSHLDQRKGREGTMH